MTFYLSRRERVARAILLFSLLAKERLILWLQAIKIKGNKAQPTEQRLR